MATLTEENKSDLKKALENALETVKSTISWVEARGWTETQEYLTWEDTLNKWSTKDHRIPFVKFMD